MTIIFFNSFNHIRLEGCSSASPHASRLHHVGQLAVCTRLFSSACGVLVDMLTASGYWRSPPQDASGMGQPWEWGPGRSISSYRFAECQLISDATPPEALESALWFCFPPACLSEAAIFIAPTPRTQLPPPFHCPLTPRESLVQDKLGVAIRQMTSSLYVFGQVINCSTILVSLLKMGQRIPSSEDASGLKGNGSTAQHRSWHKQIWGPQFLPFLPPSIQAPGLLHSMSSHPPSPSRGVQLSSVLRDLGWGS